MKKIILFLFVAVLTGCGPSEPIETVESLASNPERLKERKRSTNPILVSAKHFP